MLTFLKRLFSPEPPKRIYTGFKPHELHKGKAEHIQTAVGFEKDERSYKAGDKDPEAIDYDLSSFWADVSELPHDSGFAEFERVRQSTELRG